MAVHPAEPVEADAGQPDNPEARLLRAARILETVASQPDDTGVFERVQIIETDMKYPFLRVHEVVQTTAGAETVLSREIAVADHLLVRLAENATEDQLLALNEQTGATIRKRMVSAGQFLVAFPDHTTGALPDAIRRYREATGVVAGAEADMVVFAQITTPNDPYFTQLWGLNQANDCDMDAPEAWDFVTGSTNVLVGVIDTGVDYTHADLAANMWVNPGEIAANGVDDDANGYVDDIYGWDFYNNDSDPMDDHYHGTHVAGTIGGVGNNGLGVVGVAWRVRMIALKFMSSGGSGYISDAMEAVYYATRKRVLLTSNSWGGGGFSQSMKDAITEAGRSNILFVAAAGNSTSDNDASPHYPSSYDCSNVIAVAAVGTNDSLASFSSYGTTSVDLAAPGVSIVSCTISNKYKTASGTSMATPQVSGACALLKAFDNSLSAMRIRELILGRADPVAALSGKVATGARLNVRAALPFLEVDNAGGASNVTAASAILNGSVRATGSGTAPRATIYWGPTDGGTNPAAWQTGRAVGTVTSGVFSAAVTGLTSGARYYYRCFASNTTGQTWAPASTNFLACEVDLAVRVSLDQTAIAQGGTVTVTVAASNVGAQAATGVKVLTTIEPALGRVVSGTAGQGLYDTASGYWTIGAMASRAGATLQVRIATTTNGVCTNRATISADQVDTQSADNTAAAVLTVWPPPPTAPTGVTASDGTYTAYVHVVWNGVGTAEGYEVWRHTQTNRSGATRLTATNRVYAYDDYAAETNTLYYYWVVATNLYGASGFSQPDTGYRAGWRGVSGRQYYVSPNGNDAYAGTNWARAKRTLAAAVKLATTGDVVWVTNGVYALTNEVRVPRGVYVTSVNGPAVTVIQGAYPAVTARCFTVARDAVVDGFLVTNGWAKYGGGVCNSGTVQNCWLWGNVGTNGGGAYNATSGVIKTSWIAGNRAAYGGGVCMSGGGRVEDSTLEDNQATYGGGAYAYKGTVRRCTLSGNRSVGGYGGGIYVYYGQLEHSLVCGNETTNSYGGGVFNSRGTVHGCTIVGNYSLPKRGGGLYNAGETADSIVYYNDGSDWTGTTGLLYSCTSVTGGMGNVMAEPQFVALGSGYGRAHTAGDYRLLAYSPCVDSARGSGVTNGTTDLAGNPRVAYRGMDMGCYETTNAPQAPGAPGALYATDGLFANRVNLAWEPSAGAMGYEVWRGSSGLGAQERVACVAESAYADRAVTAGVVYAYCIKATNMAGAGVSGAGDTGYAAADAPAATGAVLYVTAGGDDARDGSSWARSMASLGAAVSAAQAGDCVLVSNGWYALTAEVAIAKALMVRSVNGPEVTVVDGGYPARSNRCFYLTHTNILVEGFTLTNGYSTYGGGAYNYGELRRCIISGNQAQYAGGGVYNYYYGRLNRCIVSGNRAHTSYGGGVYAYYGWIENCLIYGNETTNSYGGGVFNSRASVRGCTIVGNRSKAKCGGGLYNAGETAGSIVYYNSGSDWVGITGLQYSCSSVTSGVGHITAEPQFVTLGSGYGTAHLPGDYRLKAHSPCVDGGQSGIWATNAVDLAGRLRLAFTAPDMGCHESTNAAAAPLSPTDLSATQGTITNSVRLTWTAAEGALAHEIWRALSDDVRLASRLAVTNGVAFTDSSTQPRETYYYWVCGTNRVGRGAYSRGATGYAATHATTANDSGDTTSGNASTGTDTSASSGTAPDGQTNAPGSEATPSGSTETSAPASESASTGSETNAPSSSTGSTSDPQSNDAPNPSDSTSDPGAGSGDEPGDDNSSSATNAPIRAVRNDFDGDGRTDLALFSDATGYLWLWQTRDGAVSGKLGDPGAAVTAGDYDGDGRCDPVVMNTASGDWSVWKWRTAALQQIAFSTGGAQPVRGDFDGDGTDDPAVYQAASGMWTWQSSLDGAWYERWLGAAGYDPTPGDYDGNGQCEPAVYQASGAGGWAVASGDTGWNVYWFGGAGYRAVPGDYNGDGRDDLAVYGETTGYWYVMDVASGQWNATGFGAAGCTPVPGDYDGDGITDPCVYLESAGLWYVRFSASATVASGSFGGPGYRPVE